MFNYSSVNTSIGISSQVALTNLGTIKNDLKQSLEALGTGNRFSKASEDPAASSEVDRLQAWVKNVSSSISNNQSSLAKLKAVDSSQSSILKTLYEIRSKVAESIGENNPTLQQTYLQTVTQQLSAIDILAQSTEVNGKQVLAGDGKIRFGTGASDLLDTQESKVMNMRRGAFLNLNFDGAEAAERASISEAYTLPVGTASEFSITTQSSSRTFTLATGINEQDALLQLNSELENIGARAEIRDANLYFFTEGFGDDYSINYQHISGDQLFASASLSDDGKTGTIRVNGSSHNLEGNYTNTSPEGAQMKGTFVTGALAANANISVTTARGTSAYTINAGNSIDSAEVDAMNAQFSTDGVGVTASIVEDKLIFTASDTGTDDYLNYVNTGLSILDTGDISISTGRDIMTGTGLQVMSHSAEIDSNLIFNPELVGRDPMNPTDPDDVMVKLEPSGGVFFQIGDGSNLYDSIYYNFEDTTTSGTGLDQIVDNTSPLYMLNDPQSALEFVDWCISQHQEDYSSLGAFMNNSLEATMDNLSRLEESLTEQQSVIADTDEAYEVARIAKLQMLQQSNLSVISVDSAYGNALLQLLPKVG